MPVCGSLSVPNEVGRMGCIPPWNKHHSTSGHEGSVPEGRKAGETNTATADEKFDAASEPL